MKTTALLALLAVVAAGGFVVGTLRGKGATTAPAEGTGRRILYYVDPMNPSHTSDKPGFAPCGMKMEPVYADAPPTLASEASGSAPALGAVKLSLERQQLAGIQVAPVEKRAFSYSLGLPGKVVVDETRNYRVHAAVNGWISSAPSSSTGSRIQKDQVLAHLSSPEVLPAVQSFLFAINTRDQPVDGNEPGLNSTNSLVEIDVTYHQAAAVLRNLGMGQRQLDELTRTRRLTGDIAVVSPASGVLTARNAFAGLHVEKGEELFRVADLSRVWILVDVVGSEAEYLKPGTQARVSMPRQPGSFVAAVSQALPLFDNNSRTLKIRLEMENPDDALRPDMFVDVDLSVELPELIVVSSDAVLETGRKQTVFADRGGGFFDPKEVKTGRHFGDHVEIVQGLEPGERIVVSGNFLLDSESRMKRAAASTRDSSCKDPVCHMTVEEAEAKTAGQFSVYKGQTYYFCTAFCKRSFDANPANILKAKASTFTHAANATTTPEQNGFRP